MTTSRGRVITVLLAVLVLLAGANLAAYAANGGPVLLGKANKAAGTTTIKTTGKGAALKLTSKKNKAPLAVSNSTKVKKLNADLVDGLSGPSLQNQSFVYLLSASAPGATQ